MDFSSEGAIPAEAIRRSRAPERKENAIRVYSRLTISYSHTNAVHEIEVIFWILSANCQNQAGSESQPIVGERG